MSVPPPHTSAAAPDAADRVAGRGRRALGGAAPAAGLLLVALTAALLAQVAMDSLADRSDLWHWAQHAILFWSGVAAGASLVVLYRLGQGRA